LVVLLLKTGAVSGQSCECELLVDTTCFPVESIGDGLCTESTATCTKCECVEGGGLTCPEVTTIAFVFTGVANECEARPISYPQCPELTPTPTATPTPIPAPARGWIIGAAGDSCTETCTDPSFPCTPERMTIMNSDFCQSDDVVCDIFFSFAGAPCSGYDSCLVPLSPQCNGVHPAIDENDICRSVPSSVQPAATCDSSLPTLRRLCCCAMELDNCPLT